MLRGPPPGLAVGPASEGSRITAPEGWPVGNALPPGPTTVQHTYGSLPQAGQSKQAPFVPNSPHPLRTDLDLTTTAAAGTAGDLRGSTEPFSAPVGEKPAERPVDPPMKEVKLPAELDNPVSPLTGMLQARRQEVRRAMEPFGAPGRAEQPVDPPPPDPGRVPTATATRPEFVEDDEEELDQAAPGAASPGLGKLE